MLHGVLHPCSRRVLKGYLGLVLVSTVLPGVLHACSRPTLLGEGFTDSRREDALIKHWCRPSYRTQLVHPVLRLGSIAGPPSLSVEYEIHIPSHLAQFEGLCPSRSGKPSPVPEVCQTCITELCGCSACRVPVIESQHR